MILNWSVWTEWTWSVHNAGISAFQLIPYYAKVYTHMHTHILILFKTTNEMGLEVAIAKVFTCANVPCGSRSASACICKMQQGLPLPWRLSVCCFVFWVTAVQWKLSSMQIPLSFETKKYLPVYSMHLLLFCFILVFIYAGSTTFTKQVLILCKNMTHFEAQQHKHCPGKYCTAITNCDC